MWPPSPTFLGGLLLWSLLEVRAPARYPPAVPKPVWCTVPNYRFYRVSLLRARGYAASATRHCDSQGGAPDDCACTLPESCLSGYCINNLCLFPIVQIAEIEFWRAGSRVPTAAIPDSQHDAFRVMNGVDVKQTWGVWELEFYHDTGCSQRVVGGTPIFSSEREHGFGHSIDHTAPLGAHNTPRTTWQETQEPPHERFELHGPARFAFDGDLRTNWWPSCRNPCQARTSWLGLDYSQPVFSGMKCVRIVQDKDHDYASFTLVVQGHRQGGEWETFAAFNAETWAYGGVWERLSIPQGVAFVASTAHARAMDLDLNSSVVDTVGTQLDFDFGVETEIDSWRWATAEEPVDNIAREHDGVTCDRDGHCPRDPVQWKLEGSLDRTTWETLQNQDVSYPVTIHRKRFLPLQSVHHRTMLGVADIWPDGRGRCAVRR